jgi:hypothetical protein
MVEMKILLWLIGWMMFFASMITMSVITSGGLRILYGWGAAASFILFYTVLLGCIGWFVE